MNYKIKWDKYDGKYDLIETINYESVYSGSLAGCYAYIKLTELNIEIE